MQMTVHEVMDCISFTLTIFSSSINIGKWIAKRNTEAEHRETENTTEKPRRIQKKTTASSPWKD